MTLPLLGHHLRDHGEGFAVVGRWGGVAATNLIHRGGFNLGDVDIIESKLASDLTRFECGILTGDVAAIFGITEGEFGQRGDHLFKGGAIGRGDNLKGGGAHCFVATELNAAAGCFVGIVATDTLGIGVALITDLGKGDDAITGGDGASDLIVLSVVEVTGRSGDWAFGVVTGDGRAFGHWIRCRSVAPSSTTTTLK